LLEGIQWDAVLEAEDFNADDFIILIEVEDDAGMHFFRFDNLRFIQPQVYGVGFFIELDSHSSLLALRSKKAVTTSHGFTVSL